MKEFAKPGWYRISLPDHWQVDEDETPLAAYDPQGVGALQITAESPRGRKTGDRIDVFLVLRAFLKSIGVELDEANARRYSRDGLEWAATEYVGESPDGPVFWRLWFATNQDVLAFLTYACAEDDREVERAAVDPAVDSLVLL